MTNIMRNQQLIVKQLQSEQTNQNDSKRTSSLKAPIMVLHGHQGEIYSCQFSKDGTMIASAGYDMEIFIWDVFGNCDNLAVLKGHKGAIMELKFNSDSSHLVSVSTDKTVRVWDMETGLCIRNFKSHTDFVNSVDFNRRGPEMIVSASDDGLVMIHDYRTKQAVKVFNNKYQQTSVVFNDSSDQVICGGIDNVVKMWDIRHDDVKHCFTAHRDTITGLAVSNNGNFLISNSMDCYLHKWNIRPYVSGERLIGSFTGHNHNFEKNLLKCGWSPNDQYVTCGSADRFVNVWDSHNQRCLYRLPGHLGSVNATAFHPNQPIVMSSGSDKKIYLGELELDDY